MSIKKQINSMAGYFCCVLVVSLGLTSQAAAGWQLEWIDNFDGTRVDQNNWTPQDQANYNNEVQCYTDDDISANKNYDVSNGTLKIIARKGAHTCEGLNNQQRPWTSGRLNSKDKKEFLYGRIETRLRFNTLKSGTWPAFWMLENRIQEQPIAGDNDNVWWPNPGAGEIDVWEWYAGEPNTYITNFFSENKYQSWYNGECGNEVRYNYPNGSADVLQWHTYAMEWTQNSIKFYMDDLLVSSQNIANCDQYKEPMFVLLNVAMGGSLGGAIDSTLNSATLEIDYVAHCTETTANDATRCNVNAPSTGTETVVADDITIFEGAETDDWAAWDCCSGTNPSVIVDDAEHAEVMEFEIYGETVVGFISRTPFSNNNAPFNASSFMANGTLEFDLKMTAAPTAGGDPDWKLKLESSGGNTEAQVSLSSSVEAHTTPVLNEWQHYSFKLSDLANAGLSIGSIDLVMIFPTWSMGDGAVFRLDNLEILSNSDAVPDSGTTPVTPVSPTGPVISSVAPTSLISGNAYSYTLTATGADNLTMEATVLPSWLTFDSATGRLSGTPSVSDAGLHGVTLTVSDGVDSTPQSFNINVAVTGGSTDSSSGSGGGGSTSFLLTMLLGGLLLGRSVVFKQAN